MWSCVYFLLSIVMPFVYFSCLTAPLGASGKCLIGAMRLNIIVLFLIFWWKASKKLTMKHNGSCKFLVNTLYQIKEVPLILIVWQWLSWIDIIFSQEIWLILLRQFFFLIRLIWWIILFYFWIYKKLAFLEYISSSLIMMCYPVLIL